MARRKESTYSGCTITFSLPQWTADERFDYHKVHRFPRGHAYAGSYDRTTSHNRLDEALFDIGSSASCLDPMGQWVSFDLEGTPSQIAGQIAQTERLLDACLDRWRDFQPEVTE